MVKFIHFSILKSIRVRQTIHGVPPPMSTLLVCVKGQKTKQKIILAKFSPSLSLDTIRFQRFA